VIVGVIRRKPVLTHASIVCEGMLASVNSVNSVNSLGREVRMPADIVYGPPDETPKESYDDAFEETRIALRKAAERNKRYYDVRVRPKKYRVGDWVTASTPENSPEDKINGSASTVDPCWLLVRLRRSLCSSNAEKRSSRSRSILIK